MEREIKWSGYIWRVKKAVEGPGPNDFSDSKENVYVDSSGNLHLKIINRDGVWKCSEIYGVDTFGYGTYIFEVKALGNLTDNIVLGLFTYQSDDQEIDIEASRWGGLDGLNTGFAIQPEGTNKVYDKSNHHRFYLSPDEATINRFYWEEHGVYFQSQTATTTESWQYPSSSYIPKTEKEKVHLNLWLVKGEPPSDGKEQEVVITGFNFVKGRSIL